jgi:hypothetical protein
MDSAAVVRHFNSSPSAAQAVEPREVPSGVDQKQIARIMEIFSDEFLRRKLELDFVIADHAWRKDRALASFHGQLVPSAQGYIQIDRTWLNVRARASNELPFAGKLLFRRSAGFNHHRQQNQAANCQSIRLRHDIPPLPRHLKTTPVAPQRQ